MNYLPRSKDFRRHFNRFYEHVQLHQMIQGNPDDLLFLKNVSRYVSLATILPTSIHIIWNSVKFARSFLRYKTRSLSNVIDNTTCYFGIKFSHASIWKLTNDQTTSERRDKQRATRKDASIVKKHCGLWGVLISQRVSTDRPQSTDYRCDVSTEVPISTLSHVASQSQARVSKFTA